MHYKSKMKNKWKLIAISLVILNFYHFVLKKYINVEQIIIKQFKKNDDLILNRPIYRDLDEEYRYLNKNYKTKEVIVFIGDSITKRYNTCEFYRGKLILNRGIPFDTTYGLLERITYDLKDLRIKKIFLMIGINDLKIRSNNNIMLNIQMITSKINAKQIYIQSMLPIAYYMSEQNKRIIQINNLLMNFCKNNIYEYIDLHSHFLDERKGLSSDYSRDGVHLNLKGYILWSNLIRQFIDD